MNITPSTGPVTAPTGIRSLQTPGGQTTTGSAFQTTLNGISDALAEADLMSQQVATGQISDLSQVTAAAAKAELAVQLTVAFRDRAIDSFQQIMRMQI